MPTALSMVQACYNAIKHQSFVEAYAQMFDVVRLETPAEKEQLFRLRYKVFCEENDCDNTLHYPDGLLTEAADEWAAHFMLKHKESGEIAGGVSVVLPDLRRPQHYFPVQNRCDHPLVHLESETHRLCEIYRLFMMPHFRRRPEDGRVMPTYYEQDWGLKFTNGKIDYFRRKVPYAPLGLLKAAFETALQNNVMDCVMVVESHHLQSLQDLGMSYRVLGPSLPGHVTLQPVIFNIKIALDHMREENRHCYELLSEQGALARRADDLNRQSWHDHVFSGECWDEIYNKLL